MILKKCHITNFGTLKDIDYDFNSGLNTLVENNGKGKSTFAAFIKAMLYGLETSSKSSKELKERKHYYPFNGNSFGGSLVVEDEGKTYKIVREFDRVTATKDMLEIYDDKNVKLSELSGQKIDKDFDCGLFFLGIDKKAFERCNFIYSNDLGFELNDSIKHKLNDLVINQVDDNSYSTVINDINEDLKCSNKTTKKYGNRIKEKIQKLDVEINDCYKKIEEIKTNSIPELESCYKEYSEFEKEINDLSNQLAELDKKTIDAKNYENYQEKLSSLKAQEEEFENIQKKYSKGLLNQEEIEEFNKLISDFNSSSEILNQNSLTKEDDDFINEFNNRYKAPINQEILDDLNDKCIKLELQKSLKNKKPSYDEESYITLNNKFSKSDTKNIFELQKEVNELDDCKKKVDDLKNKLKDDENNTPTQEETNKANEGIEKIQRKKKELEDLETEHNSRSKFLVILLTIITFGIYFFINKRKEANYLSEKDRLEKEIQEIYQQINVIFEKYNINSGEDNIKLSRLVSLESNSNKSYNADQIELLEQHYKESKENLNSYFEDYGYYHGDVEMSLNSYQKDYVTYTELKQKHDLFEGEQKSRIEEFSKLDFELQNSLNVYLPGEETPKAKLDLMKSDLSRKGKYDQKLKTQEQSKKDKEQKEKDVLNFVNQHDLNQNLEGDKYNVLLKTLNNDLTLSTKLQADISESRKKCEDFKIKNNINEDIDLSHVEADKANTHEKLLKARESARQFDDRISALEIETQKLDEFENKIEESKSQIEEYNHELEIIKKTKHYVEQAEKTLEEKYIYPVKDKFTKYANLMKEHIGDNTNMDFDYNITKDIDGKVMELGQLSDGERSMILFALRLAVIDNMNKNNKTFLILDDPFVHLDADNFKNMNELVKDATKEKQIIYFTCHDARNI